MRLLAIDSATYSVGVALFEDGQLLQTWTLTSKKDKTSDRIADLLEQFKALNVTQVEVCVTELVPAVAHPSVTLLFGAIFAELPGLNVDRKHFISPSSWKALARRAGCLERSPKGLDALDYVNPRYAEMCLSDDAADAVLIGLAYLEKMVKPKQLKA